MVWSKRKNIDDKNIMIKKYIHRYKNKGISDEEIAMIGSRLEELSKDDTMTLSMSSLSAYIIFDVNKKEKSLI